VEPSPRRLAGAIRLSAYDPPVLTALMPVKAYDPLYLRAAVASMLVQSSPDWRLLVIDDGKARAELARLLPDDERIRLVSRETPTLAGALNAGMRRAETEFVAILLGLEVGGMDESLGGVGVDDYDFPWTMAERGAAFTAIPDCLYVARDHRRAFRLTTHLPLSHHKREIARIMRKHGVARAAIRARVARAEQGYLRQCLYRNRLDRLLSRRDPAQGWREPYA
jgi:glycosyltransferase involved in cell wall biosynthesis